MWDDESTVRYTADEVTAMRRSGEDRTDWGRVDALTKQEVDAAIDPEDEGVIDWSTVQVGIPGPKQQLTVRFDQDVVEWFKAQGPGYQTRMNAVLRSFMAARRQQEGTARGRL